MAGLAAVLERFERGGTRGDAFKLFMASYLAFRLMIDTIKPGVRLALGLTAIQWACVCGLAYYGWWLSRSARAPRVRTSAIGEAGGR